MTSHNDADHIGGHAALIDHYETEANGIGAIYDPGIAASTQTYADYLDAVEERFRRYRRLVDLLLIHLISMYFGKAFWCPFPAELGRKTMDHFG